LKKKKKMLTLPMRRRQREEEYQSVLYIDQLPQGFEARSLGDAENLATDPTPCTTSDILEVACMLLRQKQLPIDVTSQILDMAEFWLSFSSENNEKLQGFDNMDELYLTLTVPSTNTLNLPEGVLLSKCRRLAADCTSRDQGWATHGSEHNGSYVACFSWSEIGIQKKLESGEVQESPRFIFCPNFRASSQYRHHRRFFHDTEGILQYVSSGVNVQMFLRSMYGGWTNTAKYAKLRAYFALELMEEFDYATVVR
jgi:hypothetical protein